MTVLSRPRPRLIDQALRDAQRWCAGHTIDDRPALAHAVRVAVTIGEHVSKPAPTLIAAALLHDVPDFAPSSEQLCRTWTETYGPEVPRIVAAMQAEHQALDQPDPPIAVEDEPVTLASTADKIVAITSLLRRARASGDTAQFLACRPTLLRLLPHFHAYSRAARSRIPVTMATALDRTLRLLDHAAAGLAKADR